MFRRLVVMSVLVLSLGAIGMSAASRTSIVDAAREHNVARVKALIAAKADVNAADIDGSTPLHWAVYQQDPALVDLLLRAGAKPDPMTREGVTPLRMAATYGNAPIVSRLLKAGANPKALTPNGETMVMFAARSGDAATLSTLIEAGGDVNAVEKLRGTTALMWAAEEGHPDTVKVLLKAGANPAAKSGPAGLPRNYLAPRVNVRAVAEAQKRRQRALAAGRTYEEQLEYEYEHGFDLGAARNAFTPNRAQRPPQQAQTPAPARPQAAPAKPSGTNAGSEKAEAGAAAAAAAAAEGVKTTDDVVVAGLVGTGGGGLTPLVFAAREGHMDVAKALLDGGAPVNETTNYGWTPLLTAVNNRHWQLAKMLIDHGADVNIANKGGWTPLYLATDIRNIEGGDYPVAKPDMDSLAFITLLLDKGANPDARVKDNTLTRTIFTMQWFYEDGCTAFIRAAQSSDTKLMELLLEYGADPYARTASGDTALTAAAGIGWVDGVTYERSAKENVEAVRMLLDLGVDPNAANEEGRTALMGAALKGRNEVVQLLVDHGAKLDAHDRGSRDTHIPGATVAGLTFQPIDYADGLVRVGVQSAVERPETSALIRKLMEERGLPTPPKGRTLNSICVTPICGAEANLAPEAK
jgi:ankyrin repeat protein